MIFTRFFFCFFSRFIVILFFLFTTTLLHAQNLDSRFLSPSLTASQRAYDSTVVAQLPRVTLPDSYQGKILPSVVDNSLYPWFPGIFSQGYYAACQQYASIAYTFTYEMNRLRELDSKLPENYFSPHYTYNFFNEGENEGVSFLHSFHAIQNQGQMAASDFGPDSIQGKLTWIYGYEKYYRAMKNRLRRLLTIPINSTEGILTLKNYLVDHLDGSSVGGVVCFTACAPYQSPQLPEGTPEAGKDVIVNWYPDPNHGMTIIGYNDSIRYDINNDGSYTNDTDINQDGVIDARDWEIGGFRVANSYGKDWSDQGFFYVLYHAMASDYEQGGVWNNCVFIAEPDHTYEPLLTMKVELEHSMRNLLKVMAGVSQDTTTDLPEHTIDFAIFNFQGGAHFMQGNDSYPEQKTIRFGLDITPLLSFIESGKPARFFLVIEEHDTSQRGSGFINQVSFIHYGEDVSTFLCPESFLPIQDNGITILSATGTVQFSSPTILTETLPCFIPGQPNTTQLEAEGGDPPYQWDLLEPYKKTTGASTYEAFPDNPFYPQSQLHPFQVRELPFPFPFYGEMFDTVYVNLYGMIQFSPEPLPYPYLKDATDMFKHIKAIAPAFSFHHTIQYSNGDGMFMRSSPDSVTFRWQLSIQDLEPNSIEFSVTLFPDGMIRFSYGPVFAQAIPHMVYSGIAKGDGANTEIAPIFQPAQMTGKSVHFSPPLFPDLVSLSKDGSLSITLADTSMMYDLSVQVTDDRGIRAIKQFLLSNGLNLRYEFVSNSNLFVFNEPATLNLIITNTGTEILHDLEVRLIPQRHGVNLSDSLEQITSISPGESFSLEGAFSLILEDPLPDQTAFPFTLTAQGSSRQWNRLFFLDVAAANITTGKYTIEDGVNGVLDIGEVADLVIPVSNLGTIAAHNLTLMLSTEDPLIGIQSLETLTLPESEPQTIYPAIYRLSASRLAEPGHETTLTLTITNGEEIYLEIPVHLIIGTRQIAMIALSESTSTLKAMTDILDNFLVEYDVYATIPENLNNYACCFLILGTTGGSYMMDDSEKALIFNYLNNGGNVYMESYASWYYGLYQPFLPYFHYSVDRVSSYFFNQLSGVDSTFTDNMAFLYLGASPYAIFEVTPVEPAFPLLENLDDEPKCLQFAYAGETYKTIGTFVEFGKLADTITPSTKTNLMEEYLRFFDLNLTGPYPFFHTDTTHICRYHPVRFIDDSYDHIISWQWEFPGGTPVSSTEQNPVVIYEQAGTYDVLLTISDGMNAQTMHKKNYLRIQVCTGEEEQISGAGLKIYPNPATTKVWIEPTGFPPKDISIWLVDIRGIRIRQTTWYSTETDHRVAFDISDLSPGMYLIQVVGSQTVQTRKLIIH